LAFCKAIFSFLRVFFMNIFSGTKFLLLTITFTIFQSIQPTHTPENLWSQISSRLTVSCAKPNQSEEEKLRLCAGNALFLHGTQDLLINEELLQTLDSLNVFSYVIPRLNQTHLACS